MTIAMRKRRRTLATINTSVIAATLLRQAGTWLARLRLRDVMVVHSPVSRLQRELRLGYARACKLAQRLEQRDEWTIVFDHAGNRSARILSANARG